MSAESWSLRVVVWVSAGFVTERLDGSSCEQKMVDRACQELSNGVYAN